MLLVTITDGFTVARVTGGGGSTLSFVRSIARLLVGTVFDTCFDFGEDINACWPTVRSPGFGAIVSGLAPRLASIDWYNGCALIICCAKGFMLAAGDICMAKYGLAGRPAIMAPGAVW